MATSYPTTDYLPDGFAYFKAFYSLLESGGSMPSFGEVAINKENIVSQHCGFYGGQTQPNHCTAGSRNPYSQQAKPGKSISSNPYQTFSPVPHHPDSNNSTPTNLTQDQLARIEENRKRALAIRMKKQKSLSY